MGDYIADRMGKQVRVPSLESFGYDMVGGRVLPDTDGLAAQFVFADEQGRKVSLYVRSEQADGVDITYALADGPVDVLLERFGSLLCPGHPDR